MEKCSVTDVYLKPLLDHPGTQRSRKHLLVVVVLLRRRASSCGLSGASMLMFCKSSVRRADVLIFTCGRASSRTAASSLVPNALATSSNLAETAWSSARSRAGTKARTMDSCETLSLMANAFSTLSTSLACAASCSTAAPRNCNRTLDGFASRSAFDGLPLPSPLPHCRP